MASLHNKTFKTVLLSPVSMAFVYGVMFTLLTASFDKHFSTSSLTAHGLAGAIYGIAMAFLLNKQRNKHLLTSSAPRSEAMDIYLKKAQVPSDRSRQIELIQYMDQRESFYEKMRRTYYPKKYSKLLRYTVIAVVGILLILYAQSKLPLMVFLIIGIVLIIYGETRLAAQRRRIRIMREKLVERSITL